jgi:tetratricopeptide (TPR) repeat protein
MLGRARTTRRRFLHAAILAWIPSASLALSQEDGAPTYARDIAPILQRSCVQCHRPGEVGPFPLLTYEDAAKRAKQIALVTGSRYMPPWLPGSDGLPLAGNRALSAVEIEQLRVWSEAGAPEGDPRDAPPPPSLPTGWMLSEPDLVLELRPTFTLPAEGRDVYRNFLIRVPVRERKYVRSVEFRPGNRAVIHHAVLFVDRTRAARALDRADPGPGYAGMGSGPAQVPDGIFVGWAPGRIPDPGSEDLSWRLEPGSDLVLQLHMRPTGKPEPIAFQLGFHFASRPPSIHPVAIRLMSLDIDLPPGAKDVAVIDRYELPVDLEVLGVYPHAHNVGKECLAEIVHPDGRRETLFHIPQWDFDWQDAYRFSEPPRLVKGTVIEMRWTYDNSAENPDNPNDPPQRIVFGERSVDEMGELLLEVVPSPEDLPILWRDFAWKQQRDDLAYFERKAREDPDNPQWLAGLASRLLRGRRVPEAIAAWRRVVELRPDQPGPLAQLGHALVVGGEGVEAVEVLRKVLALEPNRLEARIDLANALVLASRDGEARAELERLLELDPKNAAAHVILGELLARAGEAEGARTHYEAAIAANPEHAVGLRRLAELHASAGRSDDALALYRRAVASDPDDADAHHDLGLLLERRGSRAEALAHLELAHALEPGDPVFELELERVRGSEEPR